MILVADYSGNEKQTDLHEVSENEGDLTFHIPLVEITAKEA